MLSPLSLMPSPEWPAMLRKSHERKLPVDLGLKMMLTVQLLPGVSWLQVVESTLKAAASRRGSMDVKVMGVVS